MRQLGWKQRFTVAAICIVCTVGLGLLLGLNPRQNMPFLDATTNVLSVVATFLMMWRYKEQWLLYILLNINHHWYVVSALQSRGRSWRLDDPDVVALSLERPFWVLAVARGHEGSNARERLHEHRGEDMRRGLTLGKFAPFHRGHQMLVETALAEVDELVIMVYATDVIDVPLQVRAGWIRQMYPTIRIIEAWDGPDRYGDTPEICREQERYILKKLNGLRITHFYSSEFYGDHVSRALGAVDRRIDEARVAVPISGTALREDYFGKRQHLAPVVYTGPYHQGVLHGRTFDWQDNPRQDHG
jgi:phosphopantetheine adenylyltransferase